MIMRRVLTAFTFALVLITVTGMDTTHQGPALYNRYGSIPKGVVFEGNGESIEEIKSISFDAKKNEFLLNQKYTYQNPVHPKDFAAILRAISEDDLYGISYTTTKEFITYGKLARHSLIAKNMLKADLLLGGIVYGIPQQINNQKLPGGYAPIKVGREKIRTAACFSFVDYVFTLDEKNKKYSFADFTLLITIVPLAKERAADGGHLPDKELADDGEGFGKTYGVECKPNVDHILNNRDEYLKIPIIETSVRYGEAAAFARRLRDSGVDLKALLKTIR